ncbi:condensation domain-containing protein [Actinokineospora soli]|uniref:Condensation domain-containing protein n=1 Tax=Actinokineospora soli TaxID=1048753 RepID=A0ABW2TJA3_9PSEU
MVYGWHVRGAVDPDTLREAMDLVVCRHEALRTVVVRGDEDKYQTVLPASPTKLRVVDLPGVAPADRAAAAEDLLIDLEQSDYPVADLPLFQAVLARFDDDESVLVLIAHHTAVDGWSMHLLIRDLTAFYAVLRGHELPDLPELTQYQEYVRWERERFAHERLAPSREYWATQLEGARILALPTDWRKSEGRPKSTAAHRFLVDEEVTAAAIELAKETRGSAFMVMLAAYEVFLSRRTGETDILVTTLASGRGQARFQETVGSFFNFVPLRTDLSGATTFREVVAKVRATCLKAYSHQVPFAQVMAGSPELGASFAADDAAVFAFQVFQFPYVLAGERVGDLELTEIRRRLRPQDSGPDIPDGALWTLDVDGSDMVGNLQYNTNIFRAETIAELVTGFLAVLRETVTDPDSPLGGNR